MIYREGRLAAVPLQLLLLRAHREMRCFFWAGERWTTVWLLRSNVNMGGPVCAFLSNLGCPAHTQSGRSGERVSP
jgi:hypothetical protein